MQIPSLLYGDYDSVKKRCRQALKHYMRGQQLFPEALTVDGMVDTADEAGLIVVEGPSPLLGDSVQYHCFVPFYLLASGVNKTDDRLDDAGKEDIFTALIDLPWGLLCMFSPNAMNGWLSHATNATNSLSRSPDFDRLRRYIQAVLRHWDLLDAQGRRYSDGSNTGDRLWSISTPIKYALANMGVPHELLHQPLPPGGLYALLAEADPAVAGDLVELGAAHASAGRGIMSDPSMNEPPVGAVPDNVFMSESMSNALRANDPARVRRLIEAGESIDATDMGSLRSPLLWAAEEGHTDLVRFLLEHGANIADQADEGESPLMLAVFRGHGDVARLLLDRGADLDYVTDKGWDARRFAELGKHEDMVALLEQAQRRPEISQPG
jgi:hypothetical protein